MAKDHSLLDGLQPTAGSVMINLGRGDILLQFFAQVRDVDAQIVGLLNGVWPPDFGQ